MRRIVARVVVACGAGGAMVIAGGGGCANMGAPPGGPERTVPPVLARVTPDSGATNVRARGMVFEFDEVVSDREIANLFLISPREGAPRVIWRRERIEVRPRRPFRPNTAYSVTLLPGLLDLRGNRMPSGKTVVFSTGPTFPAYVVSGRVFDWINERVAPNAAIEVIRRPDSLPYVGVADSSGQFAVGPLDEGTYTVRALMDNNRNRVADSGEPWDSVTVQVQGTSPFLELLAAPRDTIAPRLLTVSPRDSVSLSASFDRPLDPATPLTAGSFRIVRSDSTPLRVASVRTRAAADSIGRLMRARADSIARARDTTGRAARDTIRPDTTTRPAPIGQRPTVPPPKPSRPAPTRDVVVSVDSLTPFVPGSAYRVTAVEVRGLSGHTRTSERVITLPPARRDTTPPPPTPPPSRPPTTPARPPDGALPP